MTNPIVIIGFPKCGTSALMRQYIEDPDVEVLRHPGSGSLEVTWPSIKEIESDTNKSFSAHKFTAYIYNRSAIDYLRDVNQKSKLVLCIRDPRKALISWHHMHTSLAKSGSLPAHFAFKERDFYASCSIPDYYDRYAKEKLRYDKYFNDLIKAVPKERLIVVSQERMAEDMHAAAAFIKEIASPDHSPSARSTRGDSGAPHTGYADKHAIDIAKSIADELEKCHVHLYASIRESGVHQFIGRPLSIFLAMHREEGRYVRSCVPPKTARPRRLSTACRAWVSRFSSDEPKSSVRVASTTSALLY